LCFYLIETVGSGAAVFDCESDGWLDIFFVHLSNGAPASIPGSRDEPAKDWSHEMNRLYRQKPDGALKTSLER
jgi:hypothetical protein